MSKLPCGAKESGLIKTPLSKPHGRRLIEEAQAMKRPLVKKK